MCVCLLFVAGKENKKDLESVKTGRTNEDEMGEYLRETVNTCSQEMPVRGRSPEYVLVQERDGG